MGEILKKLKKLRGRGARELRVRGMQALHAGAERGGWSSLSRTPSDAAFFKLLNPELLGTPSPTPETLLEHFRARTRPRFFAAFHQTEEARAALLGRFGAGEAVVGRARRIAAGRFDLLGLRDLDFGTPVNWHLEPLSGVAAPRVHWSRVNYLDAEQAGDKKITWELNRHQYFMTLGRAYRRTSDEEFARTFVEHVNSWIDENPPKVGINWASSLEVAFRSISWLWALHFFKDSPHLTPPVLLRMWKLLYLHARHLETYLSTYFSPNTHLTGEALGLFYLGTLLPEFGRARRWRTLGRDIMLRELDRHVRPDGVYFEQASYYQRYTADFYTHLLLLLRANGEPVAEALGQKLVSLLDHLRDITRPDGSTPLYGDDDGGRLVMLDERGRDDFRPTLALGALIFNRPDYKFVAGGATEEMLWLAGAAGLRAFDELDARPPAHESRAYPDGGYYVMRDGWSPDSNYLLIDCGLHGALRHGHAHADALSFDLAARGRTLLVDPGTYTYTGSAPLRDHFRSSPAHNTLSVDGESSSVPDGAFSWRHVAQTAPLAWASRERFDYFEGRHDGYERLASPVTHARAVLFLKGDYWVIRDRVETAGEHAYQLHFHFAPDAHPSIEAEGEARAVRERAAAGAAGLELFSFGGGVVGGGGGEWETTEGWVSRCYRERQVAPVLTFSARARGAQEFFTFLVPRRAGQEAQVSVREIEAAGGRAFEILDEETRDVLLVGRGRVVEAARLASDFELAWARFARPTGTLEELVLIGGRRLSFDGREIVNNPKTLDGMAVRCAGHESRRETDAGADVRPPIFDNEASTMNL